MRIARVAIAAALAILAAQAPGDRPVVLHPVMKNVVAPQANILWDVGNRAMDDDGKADASKIKPADWTGLAAASTAMKNAALQLANAPKVIIAGSGDTLQDGDAPGASTAAQMQSYIDADPKAFAAHARELADVSEEFLQAATARDAAKLTAASGRLDEVCESCHSRFWYPQQKPAN